MELRLPAVHKIHSYSSTETRHIAAKLVNISYPPIQLDVNAD